MAAAPDSETFRAALASALSLASDPRHVVALSRIYAHAVGACDARTPLAAAALAAADVPGLAGSRSRVGTLRRLRDCAIFWDGSRGRPKHRRPPDAIERKRVAARAH